MLHRGRDQEIRESIAEAGSNNEAKMVLNPSSGLQLQFPTTSNYSPQSSSSLSDFLAVQTTKAFAFDLRVRVPDSGTNAMIKLRYPKKNLANIKEVH